MTLRAGNRTRITLVLFDCQGKRMDSLLFHNRSQDLREWLRQRGRAASAAVKQVDPDRVIATPSDDLARELFEQYHVDEPSIDLDGRYMSGARDTRIDVTGNFRYGQRLDGDPTYTDGTEVEVHVPATGAQELFQLAASTHSMNPPRGRFEHGELVVTFRVPSHKLKSETEQQRLKDEIDRTLDQLSEHVSWARRDVDAFNTQLRSDLETAIEARRQKVLADRDFEAFLGIPMTPRESKPIVAVPLRRQDRYSALSGQEKSVPFEPEPAFTTDQARDIIRTIVKWREGTERLPQSFAGMDEEALRDSLLIVLNGTFEWAGSEVFQRNGKTDITVHVPSGEGDPKSSFVAELKFWRGPAAFPRAVDQLLGYTLWRDSVCALVLLIANRDASAVISKAGELMVAHENCKRGSEPLAGEGSFVFQHPVDDSKELQVVLVPVVIPREVND